MSSPQLKQEIGLLEATFYGVGLILGAGIYTVIGEAAGVAGESLIFSFLLASFVALLTGLTYCELSSTFPEAGAEFVYIRKVLESDILSTAIAGIRVFMGVVSSSAVALAFAGYLGGLLLSSSAQMSNTMAPAVVPYWFLVTAAVALVTVMSLINFYGINLSAKFNVIMTLVEAFGLFIIIALGINSWQTVDVFHFPSQLQGLFSGTFLVFFAYIGFSNLANMTEEVRKPEKNIPRAILLSIAITTIIYALVAVSSVGLAEWQVLGTSDSPLALAASNALGKQAFVLLAIIALVSTTNTVLIELISTSRMLYGVSKKKYHAFPEFLAKVHKSRRTPWVAILVIGLLTILFILPGNLGFVVGLTNIGLLTVFIVTNFTLIWMRLKKQELEAAFRLPFNLKNVPITAVLGLVTSVLLIAIYFLQTYL